MTKEQRRLDEARTKETAWKKWGPYLSERQWGTVREDYSEDGNAWDYFTHDQARSRAYRWGEDGLAGISDDHQILCFALALWNGKDPIVKERLFGLTNSQGNHGEDVKEYYFYLDSTPTHSYMKYLYKYPQAAYPYADLIETNRHRGRQALEYELLDTGVFDQDRYFDVFVEYAKAGPEDLGIRIVLGLTERGVHIVFVKENLTFTGEDSPMSNLLLSVMGAFAQFERELIRERQREGIAIAKREGKYRGRKPSLTPARATELRRRVADGDSKAALAREFGISRDTLYRYVRSKNAGLGSLQNELYAGNRRRETMSESEMQAELERLRAENAQLKSKDKGGLTLKVSEKGGVSLYGMGRFPVTLYKEQWLRILASAPEIEAFIRENDSKLKTKE